MNSLTIGVASLLLATTSAIPIIGGPGPVEHWFASSYVDSTCGGVAFQNFSGSSSSCNVIEDSHPPADFLVTIGSILIGSDFGTYDFTFLQGGTCQITGLADIIHEVTSGETSCVAINGAGSFNVNNVSPTIVKPRLLPESTWDATFYSGANCGGSETATFSGSSSTCQLVTSLLQPPKGAPATSSVLISGEFATYDFSFFQNENCQITGLNDELFQVTSGESLCVAYSDAVSFQVTDLTAETKRSAGVSLATKRSPTTQVAARGPGPVSIWNVTTYGDQNCAANSIQSFQGSGSSSCDVITGNDGAKAPALPLFIEAGSVLVSDFFGEYDFSFFSNQECQIGPLNQPVYTVEGEECISLGSLNPESFSVNFIEGTLKARQGGVADFWEVSTFTSTNCAGTAVENIAGAGSVCDTVAASSPAIKSVLLFSTEGTYDYTFYSDATCVPTGVNDAIHEVSTGESLCVTLPTGLDLKTFKASEVVAPRRK